MSGEGLWYERAQSEWALRHAGTRTFLIHRLCDEKGHDVEGWVAQWRDVAEILDSLYADRLMRVLNMHVEVHA